MLNKVRHVKTLISHLYFILTLHFSHILMWLQALSRYLSHTAAEPNEWQKTMTKQVCVYMTLMHSLKQLPLQCLHLECATVMTLCESGDISPSPCRISPAWGFYYMSRAALCFWCVLTSWALVPSPAVCGNGSAFPQGLAGISDICLKPSLWTGAFFFFFCAEETQGCVFCIRCIGSLKVVEKVSTFWLFLRIVILLLFSSFPYIPHCKPFTILFIYFFTGARKDKSLAWAPRKDFLFRHWHFICRCLADNQK